MPVVAWSGDFRGKCMDDAHVTQVFRGGRPVSVRAAEMQPGDVGGSGQGRYRTLQEAWRDGVICELLPITRVQRFA